MRWCRQSTDKALDVEGNHTRLQILACENCRAYANEFNEAMRDNEMFGCGLSGPLWPKGTDQYQECFHIQQTERLQEFDAAKAFDGYSGTRAREIKECKAKFRPEDIEACNVYSDHAVRWANYSAQNSCGPASRNRWSTNRDHHFAWCIQQTLMEGGKAAITYESEFRREAAVRCTAFGEKMSPDGVPIKPGKRLRKPKGGSGSKDANSNPPKPSPDVPGGSKSSAAGTNSLTDPSSKKLGRGGSAMDRLGGGGAPLPSASGGQRGGSGSDTSKNIPSAGGAGGSSGSPASGMMKLDRSISVQSPASERLRAPR